MPEPIRGIGIGGAAPAGGVQPGRRPAGAEGVSFEQMLLESLEQVDRLQREADAGIERLMTGQTTNVAEVFSAVRKADVAFSLLMEIRNKLIEAYQQIQQMRI